MNISIKHPLAGLLVVTGLALANVNPCLAEAVNVTGSVSVEAQPTFSPGMRDVLKMLDAKVDIGVIKAYIRSTSVAFRPSATEIIALKQRGVPDDVLTALIQRGAEVRAQMAQAAAQSNAPAEALNVPFPGYGYGDGNTVPDYTYPAYADYGYPYSGYPYYGYYGYPYSYWWNNYSYPWAFYSPFYFGFGHHRFGDFNHFRGGNRFHDGRSFAFHGRPGFGGHVGPWSPVSGGFAHRSFANHGGFAFAGARPGGFSGHAGGFSGGHMGGFGGHAGGFSGGHSGGFGGGHAGGFGGGHGGGGHR